MERLSRIGGIYSTGKQCSSDQSFQYITYKGKNLLFADAQDHTMNFLYGARFSKSIIGGTQGTEDGGRLALFFGEKQRLKLLSNDSRSQDYSDDSEHYEDESSDDEDQTPDNLPVLTMVSYIPTNDKLRGHSVDPKVTYSSYVISKWPQGPRNYTDRWPAQASPPFCLIFELRFIATLDQNSTYRFIIVS